MHAINGQGRSVRQCYFKYLQMRKIFKTMTCFALILFETLRKYRQNFFLCVWNAKWKSNKTNKKHKNLFVFYLPSRFWYVTYVAGHTSFVWAGVFTDAPMNFLRIFRKRRLDESKKLTELDFREKFLFGDPYLFYRSHAKINILTLR